MSDTMKKEFLEIRAIMEKNCNPEDLILIDKAYELAVKAHEGQKRLSGEDYVSHPISVARILANMGMDASSVIAALLHDTVEDTDVSIETVMQDFGTDIALLVDGVTKLGKVPLSTKEEVQAENLRKMLLAMNKDIRVIIIKLADRIHNMRTLSFMPPQKRLDKALETLEIYAPIAHRLGIRAIKEELEDLSISFLDPVAYHEIESALEKQSTTRMEFLENIKMKIGERVHTTMPHAKIDGRIKSVHGIYKKMYMQNKNFDEIYDVYAVRIIVNTVEECYNCFGMIHDMFQPILGRFKDYISTPKPNMYQSLHTTVLDKEGIPFEVQIRTWEMHHTAEYGVAAHWKYKIGMNSGKEKIEERLVWVRQLLESQSDGGDVEDIVSTIKTDLIPEEVFVFTPKGDVICLPLGATVIDFAYAIHSAVGNKMVGAKVDGRIVSLDYQVKTGEIVHVLTSSQQGKGPSRDWLKIVKTSQARTKIRSWYKKEKREENIVEGRLELEREFRRNNMRFTDDQFETFVMSIAERQKCKTMDDFFAAIGYGGISISKMMPRIKEEYSKTYKSTPKTELLEHKPVKKTKSSEGIVIEGVDNCLVKFARCCNPLPGDDIIGFITRGHGVSVHKRDCTNVPKSIPLCNEPERWINAYWDKNVKEEFQSTLMITALSRLGLLADVSGLIAALRVNIHATNTRSIKDGRCMMSITITVNGAEHLKSVIAKLEKIDGVLMVERATM